MLTKQQLREQYFPIRKALAKSDYAKKHSQVIREKLSQFINQEKPNSVLIYHSAVDEVDVVPLLQTLVNIGNMQLYLPSTKELAITQVTLETKLKKGLYSIFEPAFSDDTFPTELDIAIVPAVVFDENGFRLGRGAGWYDRLFEKLSVKTKIGVSFDKLIIKKVLREKHDKPVDLVISEKRVIDLRQFDQKTYFFLDNCL